MGELIQRGGARLVVGLGVTGLSVVRFCTRRHQSIMVVDESMPVLAPDVQKLLVPNGSIDFLFGPPFQELCEIQSALEAFVLRFVEIIVSPGIAMAHPVIMMARKLDIPVVNDIVLFLRFIKAEFPDIKRVAITGSNGKSTVTDAIAKLGQALGVPTLAIGNIGVPVLDVLDAIQTETVLVMELSSYQLELVDELDASVAVLLNMSNDHLDRHGTMTAYWQAKQKIYEGARGVVVNRDDPLSAPLAVHKTTQGLKQYIRFGLAPPDKNDFGIISRNGCLWLAWGIHPLLATTACQLQGPHNQSNLLAVFAIANCLGWPLEQCATFLQSYSGLQYRCQVVPTQDGVIWLNDSKGTNVGASVVALETGLHYLKDAQRKDAGLWWIGGGLAKGGDFTPIVHYIKNTIGHYWCGCFLYGADQQRIAIALQADAIAPIFLENHLDMVVKHLREKVQSGDVVVFSPACASMDQFQNFEARGARFTALLDSCND